MNNNNDFAAKVSDVIAKIGHSNGTRFNKPNDPHDLAVIEYVAAKAISKAADQRLEAAEAAMKMQFANKIATVDEGETATVHSSQFSTLQLQYTNGSSSLDKAKLTATLVKRGIPLEEVEKIIAQSSKPRAGSKRFTGSFTVPA